MWEAKLLFRCCRFGWIFLYWQSFINHAFLGLLSELWVWTQGFAETLVEIAPCKKKMFSAQRQAKVEFYSHPALISTPPTSWAWMLQVRKALGRLKLSIKTLETLPPSLVEELPWRVWLSSCHSMAAPWWTTSGQPSPITQEADTDDPRSTTELDVWTSTHGCLSPSNNDEYIDCKYPDIVSVSEEQKSQRGLQKLSSVSSTSVRKSRQRFDSTITAFKLRKRILFTCSNY